MCMCVCECVEGGTLFYMQIEPHVKWFDAD